MAIDTPITVIALAGATASGKTALSEQIASYLPVEIISADSRQVYRQLTIGTAKPPAELLRRIPHHCIDIIDPDEPYSAGKFGTEAAQIAVEIHSRGRIPLIVGGSGLYIHALCEGLFDEDNKEDVLPHRLHLEQQLASEGIGVLYSELERVDPLSAQRYSDRNPRRVLRALEYYYATGRPFAEAHEQHARQRSFRTLYFAQELERAELYERINRRTEQMFADGIVEETASVLARYSSDLNSLNTVGYKECMALLRGEISQDEAVRLVQQNTRRYAKRQLTWFRRNENMHWLTGSSDIIAKKILNEYISQSGSTAGPPSPFAA